MADKEAALEMIAKSSATEAFAAVEINPARVHLVTIIGKENVSGIRCKDIT